MTQRPAEALSISEQEALLPEAFSQMRGVAYAILKQDRESKTGSKSQADDVVQDVSLSLLGQIRAGKCHAVNRGQFFSFCFAAVQRAASWKLQAITNGVCSDVDHDPAEILLLRVKRLEGDLRERRGLSVEDNGTSPLDGIDPAWLAKQLEYDAAEKAEQERQQDTLRRINQQLEALEERITALLSNIDLESMRTTNQRVKAAYRLQTMVMRLLELREECALLDEDYREQALRNLYFGRD